MKMTRLFFCVIMILAMFACEEKSTKPDNYANLLSQNTHLISVADINQNLINLTENSLVIEDSSSLNYLDVGDIIIVEPNDFSDKGLFLKITNKTANEGDITFIIKDAILTEAFINMNVEKKIQLTPEDVLEIDVQNSDFVSGNDSFNFSVDYMVYDRDDDPTTIDDQVRISGDLDIKIAINYRLTIENNVLKKYQVSCEIDKNVGLNIVTGSTSFEEIDDVIFDIAYITFSPQLIFIEDIPLVINPQLQLSLGLDGELMVDFTTEIDYSEVSESGLEYDVGLWSSINFNENYFSPSQLSDNNELDFTQKTIAKLSAGLFNSELTSISVNNSLDYKTEFYATLENCSNIRSLATASQRVVTDFKMSIISSLLSDKYYDILAYEEVITDDFSTVNNPNDMVYVSGGSFIMGNTLGLDTVEDLPPHQVFVSPFYMCIHEVTQEEYSAIMGANPSSLVCTEWPVEKVSRSKAYAYCNLLSIEENRQPCYSYNQDGTDPNTWPDGWTDSNNVDNFTCDFTANGYRLPTEAEWEYAARGATNNPDYIYAGSDHFSDVVGLGLWEHWWGPGAGEGYYLRGYSNVCSRNANSLGIYDMSGSVWEMCWDYYALYNTEFQVNPTGPESGVNHVLRGGSVENIIEDRPQCQVIYRGHFSETVHPPQCIGFRVVMNADQDNLGGNND